MWGVGLIGLVSGAIQVKRILSGSDDKTIRVWNADTGEAISAPVEGHTDMVTSVAFSYDGKRIVSGSYDKTIRVWNADTGEAISAPFEGHTHWVMSVAFSHDGKRIVSGSFDKTIRVWNADTGELISAPFAGQATMGPGFQNNSRIKNGWLLNLPSELLFWVPPWSQFEESAGEGAVQRGEVRENIAGKAEGDDAFVQVYQRYTQVRKNARGARATGGAGQRGEMKRGEITRMRDAQSYHNPAHIGRTRSGLCPMSASRDRERKDMADTPVDHRARPQKTINWII
ncbi:WD40-repeat-containing domain protein [Gautieria morchelliformis]|nr:WD40-repeat-containing domain protein [Gautieria morchelliformis]